MRVGNSNEAARGEIMKRLLDIHRDLTFIQEC